MILECPSCSTRYLVQIGLFAQGGRRVRCAKCKHQWHVRLPTSVDVVTPFPDYGPIPSTISEPLPPSAAPTGSAPKLKINLPAVIKKKLDVNVKRTLIYSGIAVLGIALIVGSLLAGWRVVVSVFPELAEFYHEIGLYDRPDWEGLIFEDVKSELKYDSGAMKLHVDGVIRNASAKIKTVPDIKVRALGADKKAIQSWWVDAPAPTIAAGAKLPFHTEIGSPMEHTIEDVNLEFIVRKEKANGR